MKEILFVLVLMLLILGTMWLTIHASNRAHKVSEFKNGLISEKEYCETYADNTGGIPARCFKYFKIDSAETHIVGRTTVTEYK